MEMLLRLRGFSISGSVFDPSDTQFLQSGPGRGGKKKHTAEKCAARGGGGFVEVREKSFRRGNEILHD